MPELPEVETLRRCITPLIVGRTIDGLEVRETRLRYPLDEKKLRRACVSRVIRDVRRRSKYLLIDLDGGHTLMVHLGMSGRLLVEAVGAPLAAHVHVRLCLGDEEIRFRDPRRFGFIEALRTDAVDADPRMRRLGPEPLSNGFDGTGLFERSRGSRQPIKNFLMNANHVVGVGNIYASEALFLAGIHPRRAAGRVGLDRWRRLMEQVRRVLQDAIAQGGTTLNDWQNAEGEAGYFQVSLRVYGREGETCGCGKSIRREVLGGRSTFYCPRCQR